MLFIAVLTLTLRLNENNYLNDRNSYIFLFPLVLITFLPYFFSAPLCFSPDVYNRKKKGKVILPAYLVYTGFLFFKPPGVCCFTSYAPRIQRH